MENLKDFNDIELCNAYNYGTHKTVITRSKIIQEMVKRYPDTPHFEVNIAYNVKDKIPIYLYGPVSVLRDCGWVHPVVLTLLTAYTLNQEKEDLYFNVSSLCIGGEVYTIA